MEDLIIIGAGPAGMTAGLYAARKGLTPLIISKDIGGQANWSSSVENYMGFKDIRGSELMEKFAAQMREQKLRYEECEVTGIEPAGEGFRIVCRNGREYQARAVIVATGKRPRTLGAPGEAQYRGKGVSYCATCDGPLFRGARVAVVGGGNAALQAAYDLLRLEAEVHLVSNGAVTADLSVREKVLGQPKLHVYEQHQVKEIHGDKLVRGMTIHGPDGAEKKLDVDGVFIEIGMVPNVELLHEGVRRNVQGEIEVDCACRTDRPGLFAAGDVSTACGEQIVIAAGEGAKAALEAAGYLAYH